MNAVEWILCATAMGLTFLWGVWWWVQIHDHRKPKYLGLLF